LPKSLMVPKRRTDVPSDVIAAARSALRNQQTIHVLFVCAMRLVAHA